jgi:hypothetical protein
MQAVNCCTYPLIPQISTCIEQCWSRLKSRIRKQLDQFNCLRDAIEDVLRFSSGAALTVAITECLKNEPRTYNSVQLAQKLEKERSIKLSPDRLRRILKKRVYMETSQKKS